MQDIGDMSYDINEINSDSEVPDNEEVSQNISDG